MPWDDLVVLTPGDVDRSPEARSVASMEHAEWWR